jgi:hypothetical protein
MRWQVAMRYGRGKYCRSPPPHYTKVKIVDDVVSSQPLMFGDFIRCYDGSWAPEHWKV